MLKRAAMMIFFTAVLSAGLMVMQGAEKYGFDFSVDWTWEQLGQHARTGETRRGIEQLKKSVTLPEAAFLFRQLSRLELPENIKKISGYLKEQEAWGGSFYGSIPDALAEAGEVPIPGDFGGLVKAAVYFAGIRGKNLAAIRKAAPEYPLEFKQPLDGGKPPAVPWGEPGGTPGGMVLDLDLSAIRAVLDFYNEKTPTMAVARRIAGLPVFKEMLLHRKQLGYVPPPLPTEETLAKFIYRSASRGPLDMIWKWINPWNFFSLADVYIKRDRYDAAAALLERGKAAFSSRVMGRIARFAPPGYEFSETLGFGINWGIRGWATTGAQGTNLVFVKDDFKTLLSTVTHETYHRLQLKLYPPPPGQEKKEPGVRTFEDLVVYPFPEKKDREFYKALTYIFLEGTASFVGGVGPGFRFGEKLPRGKDLLQKVYRTLYVDNKLEEVAALLHQGLKSDGPFYALGLHMAEAIGRKSGDAGVGKFLQKGSVAFFKEYIRICNGKPGKTGKPEPWLAPEVEAKILSLGEKK